MMPTAAISPPGSGMDLAAQLTPSMIPLSSMANPLSDRSACAAADLVVEQDRALRWYRSSPASRFAPTWRFVTA